MPIEEQAEQGDRNIEDGYNEPSERDEPTCEEPIQVLAEVQPEDLDQLRDLPDDRDIQEKEVVKKKITKYNSTKP